MPDKNSLDYNFTINGSSVECVKSYKHLGHVISSIFEDRGDIEDKRSSFIGQVNSVLCYFGKLNSSTKLHLFNSYCISFYGCELWDLGSSSMYPLPGAKLLDGFGLYPLRPMDICFL